jgi:hypothetical protein
VSRIIIITCVEARGVKHTYVTYPQIQNGTNADMSLCFRETATKGNEEDKMKLEVLPILFQMEGLMNCKERENMCKTHINMEVYCTDEKDAYKHRERCEIEQKKEKIALNIFFAEGCIGKNPPNAAIRDTNNRHVKIDVQEVGKVKIFYWTTPPFKMQPRPSITFDKSSEKTEYVKWFVENYKDFYGSYYSEFDEDLNPDEYWKNFILDPDSQVKGTYCYTESDDDDDDKSQSDDNEYRAREERHRKHRDEFRPTMTFFNKIDDQYPSETYNIAMYEPVGNDGVWRAEARDDFDNIVETWPDVNEMKDWFYQRFVMFESWEPYE